MEKQTLELQALNGSHIKLVSATERALEKANTQIISLKTENKVLKQQIRYLQNLIVQLAKPPVVNNITNTRNNAGGATSKSNIRGTKPY